MWAPNGRIRKGKSSLVLFPRPPPAAWLHFSLPPCAFSWNISESSESWLLQQESGRYLWVSNSNFMDSCTQLNSSKNRWVQCSGVAMGRRRKFRVIPLVFCLLLWFFTLSDVSLIPWSNFHWIFCLRAWGLGWNGLKWVILSSFPLTQWHKAEGKEMNIFHFILCTVRKLTWYKAEDRDE